MPKIRLKFVRKTWGAGNLPGFIRPVVENLMEADLGEIKAGHEKYVASWETDLSKPDFSVGWNYKGRGIIIFYVMMEADSAEDATLSVWQLLDRDEGTAVRFMQISKDWKSKSYPGRFPSNAGAGHTIGLGAPQPGIESRHIAEEVEAEVAPDGPNIQAIYEYAMQVAFAGDR